MKRKRFAVEQIAAVLKQAKPEAPVRTVSQALAIRRQPFGLARCPAETLITRMVCRQYVKVTYRISRRNKTHLDCFRLVDDLRLGNPK